jgi:four helix bundle protein
MCGAGGMVARTLDELQVYRKAVVACAAVSAKLDRPKLRADWERRAQLAAASAAVSANIAEGFGQQSDRQFARYLFIARGSSHEVRSHLTGAHGRQYLTEQERTEVCDKYEEIARMLTGLIKYLLASDRRCAVS